MLGRVAPILTAMDQIALVVVLLLSFSLALAGARGLLGLVFQAMNRHS